MSTSIKVRGDDKEEYVCILPLSEEEIARIRELQSDWGVVTSEEEIEIDCW
jgi:hypothetical protein